MPHTEEELKKAMKTFRKRLNMAQLEEDSRLGYGPIGSAKGKIFAIQPPSGFGREIWAELDTLGYIKNDGNGFYTLGDKK